jgi:hypothetical protein
MILVDDRLQGLVPFLPLDGRSNAQPGGTSTQRSAPAPAIAAPVINQQRPMGQGMPR